MHFFCLIPKQNSGTEDERHIAPQNAPRSFSKKYETICAVMIQCDNDRAYNQREAKNNRHGYAAVILNDIICDISNVVLHAAGSSRFLLASDVFDSFELVLFVCPELHFLFKQIERVLSQILLLQPSAQHIRQ